MPPAHKPRGAAANDIPATAPVTANERLDAVNGIMQIGQFILLGAGQFADAGAVGIHGPALATEVVKIADANPKFAKRIDLLIEVGPYAGLVAAALPFALQILVNHGVFKPEQFANAGVVTPETLESQMKMTLMRQQMEAMEQQRAMEQEMRAMADAMRDNAEEADTEKVPTDDGE